MKKKIKEQVPMLEKVFCHNCKFNTYQRPWEGIKIEDKKILKKQQNRYCSAIKKMGLENRYTKVAIKYAIAFISFSNNNNGECKHYLPTSIFIEASKKPETKIEELAPKKKYWWQFWRIK